MPSKIEARPPIILSIAGYDPSSGAGITADTLAIAAHGCFAVTCITALTVQSTQGVKRFEPLGVRIFTETLEELAADFRFAAVKIGVLGTAEIARATAAFVHRHRLKNVVLDPVLMSSSGFDLIADDGRQILKEKVLPLTHIVTPNIDEAATLTGLPVGTVEEMKIAAVALHKMGARNVIVTGGHLDPAVDVLSFRGGQESKILSGKKIKTRSTHGTGCAFASALACHLAFGHDLMSAAQAAKQYVTTALRNAVPLGKGRGPINHLGLLTTRSGR